MRDLLADALDSVREGLVKLRHRLAHSFARLRELPADALDSVGEGLVKLRHRLAHSFAAMRDLLADALDSVREGLVKLRHRLAHAFARLRDLAGGILDPFRGALSTVSLGLRRLAPAWRPRLPRMNVRVGAALVVAGSAVALWFLAPWGSPSRERSTPEPPPSTPPRIETETSRPVPRMAEPSREWSSPSDTAVYVNLPGAYRFSYPSNWTLTERGMDAAVASPRAAAVVTVGTIEGETIEQAADLFVGRIASIYEDVEILQWETAGNGSVPVVGTATDATGDRTRFLATMVDGGDRDLAIGAFTPVRDRSLEVKARAILQSFRLLSKDISEGGR